MRKYAMLWTTDRGYMPGTNGILNALEYYHFPVEIDKYVMVWKDDLFNSESDYWAQWPDVRAIPVNTSFWPVQMNAYWYMVFSDIDCAIHLLDQYDVVLLWGADVCPLDNFSQFFDISHKLDRMILGHNEQGAQSYGAMSIKEPYGHTWDVPYADIPFFVPRSCKDILKDVLRMQATPGNMTDRMDGLNYAIRDSGHVPYVVPGHLWVMNITGRDKVWRDKEQRFYIWNQRMQSFHRKYWAPAFCESYMAPHNDTVRHNHKVFNGAWNFFNLSCRVKWEQGVGVWNG